MKKLILSLVALCCTSMMYSQILQQDNFNALNVSTIIGQSSPAYANLNGTNADYTIQTNATGKELKIISPAATGSTSSRFLWKDGLNLAWMARTPGNNIINVEYDYFTGSISTSSASGGMELYDSTYGIYLGGLTMQHNTKEIFGIVMVGGNPTIVGLGIGNPGAPVILPANTWVRVSFAYNSLTGETTFKGPGFNKVLANAIDVPFEIDYATQDVGGLNAATFDNRFDNVKIYAASSVTILAVNDAIINDKSFSFYPNPVKNIINIKSENKILGVFLYDMLGRRFEVKFDNNKADLTGFESGVYMLGVKTDKEFITKKLIKK